MLRQLEGMAFGDKSVMDNILGTLLDIKGKSKDNLQACQDLQEIGLRPKLHPFCRLLPTRCQPKIKLLSYKCFKM
jgi:hypothetical protein